MISKEMIEWEALNFSGVSDIRYADSVEYNNYVGFTYGAEWAQKKILEQAASGFEEWASQDSYLQAPSYEETWQAAKLSSMKEIESLKQRLSVAVEALNLIALDNIYVTQDEWRDEHFLNVKQAKEALAKISAESEGL